LNAAQGDPFLTSSDFAHLRPLVFQIGATHTMLDEVEDTSINFQANLTGAYGADFAVILISFTDTIIEFSSKGQTMITSE